MIHKHSGHDCATLHHFCPFCSFRLVWQFLGHFAEMRVTKQKVPNICECGRSRNIYKCYRNAIQKVSTWYPNAIKIGSIRLVLDSFLKIKDMTQGPAPWQWLLRAASAVPRVFGMQWWFQRFNPGTFFKHEAIGIIHDHYLYLLDRSKYDETANQRLGGLAASAGCVSGPFPLANDS